MSPIVSRMSGAPACSRSARELAPVSTPATTPAPARSPDSTSLAVSPTTASSLTAPPLQEQQRGQRQVRERAAAAGVGGGTGPRSISPPQPSSVDDGVPGRGEKPVARQTRIPASRQALNTSVGPGHGRHVTRADRRRVMVLERLVGLLGGLLVAEDPAEHLDLGLAHARPHVGHGLAVGGQGQVLRRNRREKASSTVPSSRTVVPAISRQATVIRVNGMSLRDGRGTGHAPSPWPGDQHYAGLGPERW